MLFNACEWTRYHHCRLVHNVAISIEVWLGDACLVAFAESLSLAVDWRMHNNLDSAICSCHKRHTYLVEVCICANTVSMVYHCMLVPNAIRK